MPGPSKLEALGALLERRGIAWEEVAFVGDDLADLQVLRRVGLPIAVANAVAEVKAVAAYVTTAAGGHGAVREAVEALLKARGEWVRAARALLRGARGPCRLTPRRSSPLGRRVVEVEGTAVIGGRRAARRRGSRARSPAGRCARTGDRLRRRQVRA